MNLTLIILLIYLAFMFLIAWYFSRRESLEAYFLNKKSTGTWVMTLSIVATVIGAGSTVAIVSEVYNTGISYGIALPCGLIFAALLMGILAKRIKKVGEEYNTYTLVDFFHKRFDSKNKKIMLIFQLSVLTLWIAVQAVAMASLASVLTDINFGTALLLVAGITILYTTIGGLKIDFITDFVQFWIILVVFLITAILGYQQVGGFSSLFSSIPKGHLNPFAFGGIIWFLGAIFLSGFYALGNSSVWQRIMATKNQKVARKSYFLAIPIILFLSLIIVFFGLVASVLLKDINQDFAIFSLMETILPPALVGVGFAAILAVIMSSVDSLLIGGSTIIYREIFKKDQFENKKEIFYARLLTAAFGIIGFSIAFLIPKIVTLSLITVYLAITLALPTIFALYSKKLSANASFCAILIAPIALFITFPILGPNSFIVPLILDLGILIFYDKIFKKRDFVLHIPQ